MVWRVIVAIVPNGFMRSMSTGALPIFRKTPTGATG
jgi:hypothetical protein